MQLIPTMTRGAATSQDLVNLSKDGTYESIPCTCLSYSTVVMLGKRLQATEPESLCSSGYVQSWIGLAEMMEIDNYEISNLRENKAQDNCFKHIFGIWQRQAGGSVGALISLLADLERFDILEDETAIKLIKRDVDNYLYKEQAAVGQDVSSGACQGASSAAFQDGGMYSPQESSFNAPPFYKINEFAQMTTDDVKDGRKTMYDAYISYVEEDSYFVMELIKHLEGDPHNLKLCIDARDLLGGQSKLTVTAKLIQERCKKVIVVVSKEFLKSEISLFQVRFAHAMSPASVTKRLVPVLIEPDVSLERYLSEIAFLTKLPYRRTETTEWFWNRLVYSIKSSNIEKVEVEPALSDVEIKTELLPVISSALLPSSQSISANSASSSSDSISSESDVDEGISSMPATESVSSQSAGSDACSSRQFSTLESGNVSSSTPHSPNPRGCTAAVTSGSSSSKPSFQHGHSPSDFEESLSCSSSTETVESLGNQSSSSKKQNSTRFRIKFKKFQNPFKKNKKIEFQESSL